MLISIVFFTLNTLAVRALALHFPACTGWQITLFRGLVGTAVVVALYSGSRGLRLKSLIDRPLVILRGVLGAVGILCFYITVIELGAARAVVVNLTYPIFAAVLASVFLKERMGHKRLIWILIGFLGLLIFMGPQAINQGFTVFDFIAICGALMAAAVVVLIRGLHRTEHSSTIFASQAVVAALISIPMATPSTASIALPGVVGLILAGIFAAAGQLTMTFAYRHLPVSKGASMQMLLPIATAVGAWIFFGERFGAVEFIGAALTLIATAMVNRQTSKSRTPMASTQSTRPQTTPTT